MPLPVLTGDVLMTDGLIHFRSDSGPWTRSASLACDEAGVAALELALVLPLLTALLLGAADIALTAARARHVEAVAQSAAQAVRATAETLLQGLATSLPGPAGALAPFPPRTPQLPAMVEVPITSLVSLPESMAGSVTLFVGCAGRDGISPAPGASCPDGTATARFASIEVRAPSGRLVPWPGDLLPANVEARTVIRLD